MQHKLVVFKTLFVALLLMGSSSLYAETYLFGAAACPPWKAIPNQPKLTTSMAAACEVDVNLFTDSFKEAMQVKPENITTLLNEKATFQGVTAGMTALAEKAKADDRVVIYVNMHGGKVEALYEDYPVQDEVFAWYTKEKPADDKAAVGKWMSVKTFRDLTNKIMAKEIIVIIEACHSGGGLHDFQDNYGNGLGHRGKDWPGREAVIFSSHEDQVANFTTDGTQALFTSIFTDVLNRKSTRILGDAYRQARLQTHNTIRATCAKEAPHAALIRDMARYRKFCTQMPTSWDPFGLLEDVVLAGTPYGVMSSKE